MTNYCYHCGTPKSNGTNGHLGCPNPQCDLFDPIAELNIAYNALLDETNHVKCETLLAEYALVETFGSARSQS